ncbi:MAG TPA: hypothetical protein ENK50_12215 [Sedimenticola sp.]|nr:hypothetical protein [Sedimenticola sp.]
MGKKKDKKEKKEKKKKLSRAGKREQLKSKKKDKARGKAKRKGNRRGDSGGDGLAQEIRALQKELEKRDALILELQQRAGAAREPESDDGVELLHRQQEEGIAVSHRRAWERHQYLRQQYEQYLEQGARADAARGLANRDLVQRFGENAGYSGEELRDILS